MTENRGKVREILNKCPCVTCDGEGFYVMPDSEGEPEQIQCQFCYEKRFPFIEQALTEILSEVEGITEKCLAGKDLERFKKSLFRCLR